MKVGQLIKVVDGADQPRWIREIVGEVGIIVRKEQISDDIFSRYDVLINEKVYRLHHLDLELV